MAIKFKEIRKYIARNARLSICFKDGHYDDYLICSDIPEGKYDDLYVYGIGKIDVEFSKDVYADHQTRFAVKDIDICPALEIVLCDRPRDDVPVRKTEDVLRFEDLRNYLQIIGHYSVVLRQGWSSQAFDKRNDIPESYNGYYVYGVGLEEDPNADAHFKGRDYDNSYTKRIVIVLSEEEKKDLSEEAESAYANGPFFLLVTADEWNHDADEWIGIYSDKKEAIAVYDNAVAEWEKERSITKYESPQRVAIFEYINRESRFREVERKELEQ